MSPSPGPRRAHGAGTRAPGGPRPSSDRGSGEVGPTARTGPVRLAAMTPVTSPPAAPAAPPRRRAARTAPPPGAPETEPAAAPATEPAAAPRTGTATMPPTDAAAALPTGPAAHDERAGAPLPVGPVAGTGRRAALVRLLRGEVLPGAVLTVVAVLAAAPAGLLWRAVAPRTQVVVTPDGLNFATEVGESFIGADATFLLVTALVGVLLGLLAVLALPRDRVGIVVGLVAGGLLGALVAKRIGTVVGQDDLAALASSAPVGTRLTAPLQIRALGVEYAWAVAAVVVHFLLVAYLGRRPDPVPVGPPPGSSTPVAARPTVGPVEPSPTPGPATGRGWGDP